MTLDDKYLDLWKNNRPEFYSEGGTHYISEIQRGTELLGFMSYQNLDARSVNVVEASVGGSYFGVSGSGNIKNSLEQLSNVCNFTLDFNKRGGWGSTPNKVQNVIAAGVGTDNCFELAKSQREPVLKALDSLEDKAAKPIGLRITLTSYQFLMNGTDNVEAQSYWDNFNAAASRYSRLKALDDRFNHVWANQDEYIFNWGIDRNKFLAIESQLRQELKSSKAAFQKCSTSAKDCQPSETPLPSIFRFAGALPLRKRSFVADTLLRDSSEKIQSAFNSYNGTRKSQSYMCNNHLEGHSRNWLMDHWVHYIWPSIEAFGKLQQSYAEDERRELLRQRLGVPHDMYCAGSDGASDPDCIDLADLAKFEDEIKPVSRVFTVSGKEGAEANDKNVYTCYDTIGSDGKPIAPDYFKKDVVWSPHID